MSNPSVIMPQNMKSATLPADKSATKNLITIPFSLCGLCVLCERYIKRRHNMDTIIKNYLEQIKVGRKQSHKNLSLYPLLSTYSSGLDYLLLDEALSEGLMEVAELDTDGSVPELKVANKSPKMILILDGEELVGAKQNRIVNTTILVQGNSTIVIPVSCVEHGRWSYDSPKFHSQERMMSSNLRARKSEQVSLSVRSTGEFRADQSAIWDGIAEKADRMAAPSPTGAMAAIYDKEMPSINEYIKHFRLIDSQVGGNLYDQRQGGRSGCLWKARYLFQSFQKTP